VCGETKLLSEFGKSGKTNGSGYKAVCKLCLAKKLADWRKANPESAKEQDRRYRARNKDKIKLKNQKRYLEIALEERLQLMLNTALKRKNVKCFISVNDIKVIWQKQNGRCAYTDLPLVATAHQIETVSLDRIDSSKDYTADNIQLVCTPINRMKSDMTEEQFIKLCQLVTQHRK
jgi:hypothetical protein